MTFESYRLGGEIEGIAFFPAGQNGKGGPATLFWTATGDRVTAVELKPDGSIAVMEIRK